MLEIDAGGFHFEARLEESEAPATVAAFRRLLPLESRIIHVRWSGEAGWIPFGDLDLGLGPENATCYPNPGEIVLYPGGVSETEILLAYGSVRFASKVGQLAGNHFLTIVAGTQYLPELGRLALWHGANRSSSRRSESKASGVVPLTGDRWNPNPLRGCRGRRRGRQVSQQVSQLTRRWSKRDSNRRSLSPGFA